MGMLASSAQACGYVPVDLLNWTRYYADAYQVNRQLLLSVLWTENQFCNRTSSKGALGIAQIMPGTAKDLGVNPLDPVQAIHGAAKYLHQLHGQLGSWELAVAGYNAGPGAVQRAGGIPDNGETPQSVEKVKAYDRFFAAAPAYRGGECDDHR